MSAKTVFLLGWFAGACAGFGQDAGEPSELDRIVYAPQRNELDELRNPLSYVLQSPGESAWGERLPYMLSQLELQGIYQDPRKGFVAIFRVGDQVQWWVEGAKFLDADLVKISEGEVAFRHYSSRPDLEVREVVKKLDRHEP